MLNTKILLMSLMSPAAAWAASASTGPSLLIIRVICAIAACFALFVMILRITESRNGGHMNRIPAQHAFANRRRQLPTP